MTSEYPCKYIVALWSASDGCLRQLPIIANSEWDALKAALELSGLNDIYSEELAQSTSLGGFDCLIGDDSLLYCIHCETY